MQAWEAYEIVSYPSMKRMLQLMQLNTKRSKFQNADPT